MISLGATKIDEELIDAINTYVKYVAKVRGWKLNPNANIRNAIVKKLAENLIKYGHLYCPCRIEKTRDTICPCVYAEREIEENGYCHCRLYVKH